MRSRSIARANMNSFWSRTAIAVLFLGPLLFSGCAMKLGKQPRQEVAPLYSAQSPEFRQAAGSLLGPNFVDGNSISTLVNGDEIFPAMLSAIHSARRSINLETYVFWDGEIAREFTAALSERARAGVHVNMILDARGTSKLGLANKKQLQDAGAQFVKYHTGFWPDPRRYNNRTHRKLLIIDGRIAVLGGYGNAHLLAGDADPTKHWRDHPNKVPGAALPDKKPRFSRT